MGEFKNPMPNQEKKRRKPKSGSFTDRYIKNLKPEAEMYQIREGRGFAIRVLPSGAKTWYFIYTLNGKRRQLNLGSYPHVSLEKAHQAYLEAAALVKDKIDPIEEKQLPPPPPEPEGITVRVLAEKWLNEWSKQNHSPKWHNTLKLALEKDVASIWEDRLAADIKRSEAQQLLANVAARAPGQARNVLKGAQAMYDFGVDLDVLEYNPFAAIKKKYQKIPKMRPKSRKRTLTEDEIKTLWNAIDSCGGSEGTKKALKLILVTGQRPGEVAAIHPREIDGEWWNIPLERIKTRKQHKDPDDHRVFLSPLALKIIGENTGYICPSSQEGQHISSNALAYHVRRNVKGTGKEPFYGLEHWTPHDLRRTAATFLAKLQCSDEIIDAIQNHSKKGTTGIYNRYKYDTEIKEWLTRWSKYLESLIGKET